MFSRWWSLPLMLLLSAAVAGALILVFAVVLIYPQLPDLDLIERYNPRIPLRIYSAEGRSEEHTSELQSH